MKRYILFAGNNYYPDGGWEDFKGSFDSIEEALNWFICNGCSIEHNIERIADYKEIYDEYNEEYRDQWGHLLDTANMNIICKVEMQGWMFSWELFNGEKKELNRKEHEKFIILYNEGVRIIEMTLNLSFKGDLVA